MSYYVYIMGSRNDVGIDKLKKQTIHFKKGEAWSNYSMDCNSILKRILILKKIPRTAKIHNYFIFRNNYKLWY